MVFEQSREQFVERQIRSRIDQSKKVIAMRFKLAGLRGALLVRFAVAALPRPSHPNNCCGYPYAKLAS